MRLLVDIERIIAQSSSTDAGGGEELKIFFDGVSGPRSETLLISKNFSPSKMADLKIFLIEIFANRNPFLRSFLLQNGWFYNFGADEMGSSSKHFFDCNGNIIWLQWDPSLRTFSKKLIHLVGTSLFALTCEYAPPPTISFLHFFYVCSI